MAAVWVVYGQIPGVVVGRVSGPRAGGRGLGRETCSIRTNTKCGVLGGAAHKRLCGAGLMRVSNNEDVI